MSGPLKNAAEQAKAELGADADSLELIERARAILATRPADLTLRIEQLEQQLQTARAAHGASMARLREVTAERDELRRMIDERESAAEAEVERLRADLQRQVDAGPLCHGNGHKPHLLTYLERQWVPIEERDEARAQAAAMRAALVALDGAACSDNIRTHDGWATTAPYFELPADVRRQVDAALAGPGPGAGT